MRSKSAATTVGARDMPAPQWTRTEPRVMLSSIEVRMALSQAYELKVRIEVACILDSWEWPPAEQGLLFPITSNPMTAASPVTARK